MRPYNQRTLKRRRPVARALSVVVATAALALGVYYFIMWQSQARDLKLTGLSGLNDSKPVPKLSELEEFKTQRVVDRIRVGESLSAALARHSISNMESFRIAQALRTQVNLKGIKPGDVFAYERTLPAQDKIEAFELMRSDAFGAPVRFRLERDASDALSVQKLETPIVTKETSLAGVVQTSLYDGILGSGGDPTLVNRFSDVFGWQIDFYRETQRGDSFKIVVESRFSEGRFIGYGRVLAAEYKNQGRIMRGYYYESDDGATQGIYDDLGESLEKTFLRSPMELTRITSRYGQRFHPVLKRQKKHNGVDYGAPTGTPFWSIADGVVLEARYSPTAGNMIRIRHRAGFVTEYFHASKIAAGIRPGVKVRQRQIVGYVGTTGRSTGPHLHFGMMHNSQYVDPGRQDFPAGSPIPTNEIKRYLSKIKPLQEDLAKISVES